MQVKQFTAPDIAQAMSLVKEDLGGDAVIVSTEEIDGNICITAATEENDAVLSDIVENEPNEVSGYSFDDEKLRESLEYHDVSYDIAALLLAQARRFSCRYPTEDTVKIFSRVLEETFQYGNILTEGKKIKTFTGTTGSGKSTAIAKVAAQAGFLKKTCCIVSTDTVRAGANKQLEAFAGILKTDFYFCKTARELFELIQKEQNNYQLILVDTPGINPYNANEVSFVADFIESVKSNCILTMDAGKNTREAIEISEIFAKIGADFLLPTRLDMTHRIGSFVSSAYANHLGLCCGGISSSIAHGLADITPESLSRLLISGG